jgi:hypothetical protein
MKVLSITSSACSLLLANFCNRSDVCELNCRISWGFNLSYFCIFLNTNSNLFEVWEVDHIPFEVGLWEENLSNVPLSSSVDIINAKQMVTLLKQVYNRYSCWHVWGEFPQFFGKSEFSVVHGCQVSLKSHESWV